MQKKSVVSRMANETAEERSERMRKMAQQPRKKKGGDNSLA